MKSNVRPLPSLAAKAAPPARWWLGWFQLLCAWLVCMLVCANLAMAMAKGWPQEERRPLAKTPGDCASAGASQRPGMRAGEAVAAKPRRMVRCAGA